MRVACVATNGFEDSELDETRRALEHAGHRVDVVSPRRDEIAGHHGRVRLRPALTIDEADPDDFDALFVPGGFSPDQLRADDRFIRFVRGFAGKPVLAICHGPQLLFSAGLLEGRTVTAWRTVQYDLSRAGIEVEDEPVVVDEELVTSRHPGDLPRFIDAAIERLSTEPIEPSAGERELHSPAP